MFIFNPSLSLANPTYRVSATGYCLKGKMTNGEKTHPGVIALSRDLVKLTGAKFGDVIKVKGVGTFIFKDLMPPKWRMRIDIYFPTFNQCDRFGVKRCDVEIVRRNVVTDTNTLCNSSNGDIPNASSKSHRLAQKLRKKNKARLEVISDGKTPEIGYRKMAINLFDS